MKILLVDDDYNLYPNFFKDVKMAIEETGAELEAMTNMETALDHLRKNHSIYGLLLLDGQFANCDLQGYDAVEDIRKFSKVPIIMISGYMEFNKIGMRNGATGYMKKCNLKDNFKSIIKKFPQAKPENVEKLIVELGVVRNYILKSLLPLDIDMQAIAMDELKKKKEYLKKMYLSRRDDYQRFLDLQYLICGINEQSASETAKALLLGSEPIVHQYQSDKKSNLLKLVGVTNSKVGYFFEMLKNEEKIASKLIGHAWGVEGVSSFHDWYCEIANILKGEV